jgi:hypothetical protein
MATNSRPGVFIQEVELSQAIALADNGSASGAFLGAFAKVTIYQDIWRIR